MMIIIKIDLYIVRIIITRKPKLCLDIGNIIDGFGNIVAAYHFLEAGNIGQVFVYKIEHLLLCLRVCFVFQYIEMLHVPAHHPGGVGGRSFIKPGRETQWKHFGYGTKCEYECDECDQGPYSFYKKPEDEKYDQQQ